MAGPFGFTGGGGVSRPPPGGGGGGTPSTTQTSTPKPPPPPKLTPPGVSPEELADGVTTGEPTSSTTYTDLYTPGPSARVPVGRSGTLLVSLSGRTSTTATGSSTSAGPLSPGTLANDSSFGTTAWTNPSNAGASDNSYATAVLQENTSSQYLKATNFGFAIPAGAIIGGIEAQVERKASAATNVTDARVRIVKGGTIGATDRSNPAAWSSSDTTVTYGSSSDVWGETWADSDINAAGFGVVIAGTATDELTLSVDHIKITVYYTTGGIPVMGFALSGANTRAASDDFALALSSSQLTTHGLFLLTGLRRGPTTVTAKYRVSASGSVTILDRRVFAIPL